MLDAMISDEDRGPEYDWLRSNNLTFRTWDCTECPDNAVCNGTTDWNGNSGTPILLPIGCSESVCTTSSGLGFCLDGDCIDMDLGGGWDWVSQSGEQEPLVRFLW